MRRNLRTLWWYHRKSRAFYRRKDLYFAKEKQIDLLLAVGGGSVIDSAKAIGYGVANEGDVWDFFDFKRKPTACLPIGVVLTIAAAGK